MLSLCLVSRGFLVFYEVLLETPTNLDRHNYNTSFSIVVGIPQPLSSGTYWLINNYMHLTLLISLQLAQHEVVGKTCMECLTSNVPNSAAGDSRAAARSACMFIQLPNCELQVGHDTFCHRLRPAGLRAVSPARFLILPSDRGCVSPR